MNRRLFVFFFFFLLPSNETSQSNLGFHLPFNDSFKECGVVYHTITVHADRFFVAWPRKRSLNDGASAVSKPNINSPFPNTLPNSGAHKTGQACIFVLFLVSYLFSLIRRDFTEAVKNNQLSRRRQECGVGRASKLKRVIFGSLRKSDSPFSLYCALRRKIATRCN